jgi:NADH-quinone oxidoreductase subunit N
MPLEEFPLLLLLATLGAVAMAGSIHFVSLFLGLETMTLGTIGMIAYPRFRPEAEEAGLKYLVLSGMSSGFLLFGIALVDLASGSLRLLPSLGAAGLAPTDHQMMLTGITLIVVGAGFKLSVVPFHIWVPDVYAGAPAPSGAYLAVVSKIAVIAVIMRLLAAVGSTPPEGMVLAVTVIAALSMLAGNLLALLQENLKRILGYSSIAHFGYLLVALLATDTIGRKAVLFYLVTYSITVIAAFGGVAVLSRGDRPRDLDQVEDLRGLFWSRPALATVMTLALLSLAGIPPAIGFVAKMYILAAAVHTELWLLTSVMVVGSVVGLFYYLRIIIVMAQPPAVGFAAPQALPVPGGIAIACLTIPLVLFGIAPEPLMEVLTAMLG